MSKGIFQTIAGAFEIALGAIVLATGLGAPLGAFLITSGAGMLLSGIGTMLQKGPLSGFATATRNPIAPWTVVYGRARVGGTIVYLNSFGDNRSYLDLVVVLACHSCESVDDLLFDQQRVLINSYNHTSYVPIRQAPSISSIIRAHGLVTVVCTSDIPPLVAGDTVYIQNVSTDATLNGLYPIAEILSRTGGHLTFTYINGGTDVTIGAQGNVETNWADFGNKVYMETMLGTQTLGTTFTGMTSGTPDDGGGGLVNPPTQPWSADCSLVGHTAVFLRLHFDDQVFSNGIPQISFRIHGKNDIRDDRTSPPTFAYTENAALICADYLAQPVWGYGAAYGTEIPNADLIAAANICDEQVQLAAPLSPPTYESRYTCNGSFQLTTRRGEVLQNLLTPMGGRLTYTGGQFILQPAYWPGSSYTVSSSDFYTAAAGAFQWRPTPSIASLYNGVKGTYISPANNWQSSDFPRYAQDPTHGYTQDDNLIADGNVRRWLDIQLPFTNSCATAQRLAKIELLRRRNFGTGTFLFNMSAYRFATLDILSFSLSYFGWSGKLLEILATRFKVERQNNGDVEAILLGVEVDVQETDSSIYAWSYGEELSAAGYQQAIVPNLRSPAPPTNLQLSNGTPILTWTAPNDEFVINGGHIEARYQVIASPPGLWISLGNISPTITTLFIPNLSSDNNYYIQLRSVNAAGVPSQWVTIPAVGPPVHQWAPHQTQAPVDDALFPSEWTFDALQQYSPTSGQDWTASVVVTGKQPVNQFIPHCPQVALSYRNFKVLSTGGSIPGGVTLYVSVGAKKADNTGAPPSTVAALTIPSGTNTNSVVIGDAYADIYGSFTMQPGDGALVNIADKLYTFQTALTNVDGNVQIGATLAATVQNLIAAVNLGAGSGTAYAAATTANPSVSAEYSASNTIHCIALTAGTSGNSLTASGIAQWENRGTFSGGAAFVWPAILGLATYIIYASTTYDLVCIQQSGSLSPGSPPGSAYTPTSLTLTSAAERSTYALPVDTTQLVRVKAAALIHGGVQGAAVDAVTTTTIRANECVDVALIDNWAGRKVAIIGRNNATAPYVSFDVTAYDPATGTFTVTQNPVAAGVQVGDAMVVCTKGVDNSANLRVISDPGLSNSQDTIPHAGLPTDDPILIGAVLRVISGTSRGLAAHIVSNTATDITVDSDLPIDATSVWIIIGATWPFSANSDSTDNADFDLSVNIELPVTNSVGTSIVLLGLAVDDSGVEALDVDAPIRMIFIFGAGMAEVLITSPATTFYQMLTTDQVVMVDATGGPVTITLPPSTFTRRSPRYVKKIDSSTNVVTVVGYGSPPETIENGTTVLLSSEGDTVTLLPNT